MTLRRAVALVFLVGVVAAGLGIGVRSTYGAWASVDEPQYLMTALSIAEDGDLDIADELVEGRWRAYSDVPLSPQTAPRADGSQLSPHDPLLPLLLAAPVRLGGWVAAKATLAVLAGLLAAVTLWVAVRRFAVPVRLAAAGVAVAAASAPLAVYGQQVYPELPAALLVVAAVGALTGPVRVRNLVLGAGCVALLPWLAVKYAPVAAALALLLVVRWGRRRETAWLVGGLALAGGAFVAAHRLVWGGWTVYASGDHFRSTGEFAVVGTTPDYVGRSLRLVGLLVDRGFGIAAWQPAWLLVVPALAWLARARHGRARHGRARHGLALSVPANEAHVGPGPRLTRPALPASALTLPLGAGWATATWLALTMHGFWWPGRQLVVVLPLAVLVVLVWLARVGPAVRLAALGLGAAGVVTYGCLLVDGYARELSWVSGFELVDAPLYQLLRHALPDYRGAFLPLHLAWIGVFAALAVAGWRSGKPAVAAEPALEITPMMVQKGPSS